MSAEALELDRLTVSFPGPGGPGTVLSDLSLTLAPGERVALVGESGSGKSLAAMAALWLLPEPGEVISGSVRVNGVDLRSATSSQLVRIRGGVIGLVPQEPASALHPTWRVGFLLEETIRAHARVTRAEARRAALALLASVALDEPDEVVSAWAHQLSGGQAQRVAIALALAGSPRYLIADEPTTALDLVTQRRVLDLLDAVVSDAGLGLLLISHDLAVVANVVDRILVLHTGMVVESGATDEVFGRPLHPATRELLATGPAPPRERPSPGNACPLAESCGMAEERCTLECPPLQTVGGSHQVRCPVAHRGRV